MHKVTVVLQGGPLHGEHREIEFNHFVPVVGNFDDDEFNPHRYWLGELEDGTWQGSYPGER